MEVATAAPLVERLLTELDAREVLYCHWKSNNALHLSAVGDNDLDLLVASESIPDFVSSLMECGFKEARLQAQRRVPGIFDFYGYDPSPDKLIHVHAHYQLVLGDDLSKNYRIPIERAYLESSRKEGLFFVPAPAMEYIVFVIRMILKHVTWESLVLRNGQLSTSELAELEFLQALVQTTEVEDLLGKHLPGISPSMFADCVYALQPGCSLRRRLAIGRTFLRSQSANARRPRQIDVLLKLTRFSASVVRSRFLGPSKKRTLVSGGALIALVGGDGAGKTTAVEGIDRWLAQHFSTTRIHMGKPKPSLLTAGVRVGARAARVWRRPTIVAEPGSPRAEEEGDMPTFAQLLLKTLLARDRYLTYRAARRRASRGSLVVSDRFPLPQVKLMDGRGHGMAAEGMSSGLARFLIRLQDKYYASIWAPEIVIALVVDPAVAVLRKTDEDPETVRARSAEIWAMDWSGSGVQVVDASGSKEQVLLALKQKLWSAL